MITSPVLKTIDVPGLSNEECQASYNACPELLGHSCPTIKDAMLCAESAPDGEDGGTCNGDSGGPWVAQNDRGEVILAGVHKAGICHVHEIPHAAVQVSYPPYLAWIKQVIGIKN